jgi:hypothetical protein
VRIAAAQPLAPGAEGGQLEPRPLLTPAEAEAEAFVFGQDATAFTLQALDDVPAEFLGDPVERLLAAGELDAYTHVLHVTHAPEHTCRDYLVRMANEGDGAAVHRHEEGDELEADRLRPLAAGGGAEIENIVVTCPTCHAERAYQAADATATCEACDRAMTENNAGCLGWYEDGAEEIHARIPHKGPGACHDCGAAPGTYHHDGCDSEPCPKCGRQLLREYEHAACDLRYVFDLPDDEGGNA